MQNNLAGQHQPFSASFCPLLQHSIPLQVLSSRAPHCEAQLFSFFSMVHEQQPLQPQKCLAPGPGTLVDSISEGFFLISAGLHGLKAHQDLELGCLLSVILKEIARA